ncbi:ABC transporter permease [Pseudoroseomonas globiformis]|uniref:ABC transporter permease n=1 Tax=Teichococcus globiformis TaxID=2307229 RepID=A0ABV7G775_9PROT
MPQYLLGRLGQALFVLWAAFTVTFVILYILPGDPILIMLDARGEGLMMDASEIAELRAQYGFDKPVIVQYLVRLWHAMQGDFGMSIQLNEAVTGVIARAVPETLKLASLAMLIALVAGFLLACIATYTRRPWLRDALLSMPALGVSVPVFWVGLLLLQFFSFRFALFPAMGNSGFVSLVLPAVTLAIPTAAGFAQLLAKSLLASWNQPYVTTALGKGARPLRVHLRHALPNALIPALTMIGMSVGNLLAGSVVTETVFSRVGIGRLTEQAVKAQDVPMVQGLVVLSTLIFVLANLAVDLLYPLVDPRIARSGRRASR